jgi:hypothetical protein
MIVDLFKSEKIIRLTPIGNDTVEIADRILNGDVRIFPGLDNIKVDKYSDLWEYNFKVAESTFSNYIYALYPVSYLLNAYEVTNEFIYLDSALKISINFIEWMALSNKNINKKRFKILSGDHAVSNRTQCLCYLTACLVSGGKEIEPRIIDALLDNGVYLSNNSNYSQYNHGLMMDMALLGLLITTDALDIAYPINFKNVLLARLDYAITRDFTTDGVHVENSPGYHFWMVNFLKKIIDPLKFIDINLSVKASTMLSKAIEYSAYITKPDGMVPKIGDTHATLKYKASKNLASKVFLNSNQVIFRNVQNSVWASLISGYKTHVHKHEDNGAFNLFYDGLDIFVDPGFLNYENNKESLEIRTAGFHNTVRPQGKNQFIKRVNNSIEEIVSYKENLSKSHIIGFEKGKKIELTACLISDYSDFELVRIVVWVSDQGFIILDRAIKGSGIEQIFNINPGLTLSLSGHNAHLCSNGNLLVELKSLALKRNLISNLIVKDSFYAEKFNNLMPLKQLIFSTPGDVLITSIKLNPLEDNSCSLDEVGDLIYKNYMGSLFFPDLIDLIQKLDDFVF